ncbi:MAG: DNA topoisomerase VI subunit B [Candidatus Diapherotrites archaeon]|nr:DNA topoisomerase VI subunit B [Candidatus Diapherotrites archaeon]
MRSEKTVNNMATSTPEKIEKKPKTKGDDEENDKGMTAQQLEKEFKEHSVAEFFKKNKQMLGLSGKIKTLTTIVHEYVSNSLDACEEAHVLPNIEVRISELGDEHYEVTVTDNGPGLTKDTLGKALGQLLAGTKFHRMIQQRGQQGIGAAGATMFSLMTTGKAIQVITGNDKNAFSSELTIDPKLNQPKIIKMDPLTRPFKGTAIKAQFKEIKYQRSEQGVFEYLRRTAIANPHAQITLTEPDATKTVFPRTSKVLPDKPIEIKPHPKGITVDALITLAHKTTAQKTASFLKNDFDRMGDKALEEMEKLVHFDLNKDPKKMAWEEAEEIVKAFQKIQFIAPRLDGLRPIGEENIKKSLNEIVQPEFVSVIERKPTVYKGGFAFQVEAAVAYGGNAGRDQGKDDNGNASRKVEIMRFANRVPLLFDSGGCALTQAVQSIDWRRYGIKDLDNAPLTVFLHICSVHIPYTGAGKQAVADEEEVLEELRLALMDTGRKIYRFVSTQRREAEKLLKRKLFMKYAKEVAIGIHDLTKKPTNEIEKKLLDIVMHKLKMDEAKETEENAPEELSDEELKKLEEKEKKEKGKKDKKSRLADEEGDE